MSGHKIRGYLAHGMCPHHKTAGFGIFWNSAGSRKRLSYYPHGDWCGPCSHCMTKSCYVQISHMHTKAVEMLSSLQGQWWVITGSLLSQSRHVIKLWHNDSSMMCTHFNVDCCIRGPKVGGTWRQHGVAGGLVVKLLDCTQKVQGSSPTCSRDLFLFSVHSSLPFQN